MDFNLNVLKIDPVVETKKVADFVVEQVRKVYRRKGVVVGLSGGIDSAVMAALAIEAVGKESVVGLILPERESSPISSQYATSHAQKLGIEFRDVNTAGT